MYTTHTVPPQHASTTGRVSGKARQGKARQGNERHRKATQHWASKHELFQCYYNGMGSREKKNCM